MTPKEARIRRLAKSFGLRLSKSRSKQLNFDNHGHYMLIAIDTNSVYAGAKFDLTLDDIDALISSPKINQK